MAYEEIVMTRTEPTRDLGRATHLHGLFALILAACVALGAIAAALALLDNAAPPNAARAASPTANSPYTVVADGERGRTLQERHSPSRK
jgi:hypothetical protein